MKKNKYIIKLQKEIHDKLSLNSNNYLEHGLSIFHKMRSMPFKYQISIGILSIALELMLKVIIAKMNFPFIFSDLPDEVRFYLTNLSSMPSKLNPRSFAIELQTFNYKTVEFDKCISYFYLLFPDFKQEYKPYFKTTAYMRNKAIHASLPEYQKYEADKVAYLSIKLHRLIIKRKLYGCNFPYKESVNDKEFYEKFESSRIERVQKVIEEAKKKAKTLDHCGCQILSDDDWSYMSIACPVCGSDATLFGDTDINVEVYSEDDYNEDLTFLASSFECEECGLKLLDAVELELAGIDAVRDRNTDLDKWHRDSAEPDYDDL